MEPKCSKIRYQICQCMRRMHSKPLTRTLTELVEDVIGPECRTADVTVQEQSHRWPWIPLPRPHPHHPDVLPPLLVAGDDGRIIDDEKVTEARAARRAQLKLAKEHRATAEDVWVTLAIEQMLRRAEKLKPVGKRRKLYKLRRRPIYGTYRAMVKRYVSVAHTDADRARLRRLVAKIEVMLRTFNKRNKFMGMRNAFEVIWSMEPQLCQVVRDEADPGGLGWYVIPPPSFKERVAALLKEAARARAKGKLNRAAYLEQLVERQLRWRREGVRRLREEGAAVAAGGRRGGAVRHGGAAAGGGGRAGGGGGGRGGAARAGRGAGPRPAPAPGPRAAPPVCPGPRRPPAARRPPLPPRHRVALPVSVSPRAPCRAARPVGVGRARAAVHRGPVGRADSGGHGLHRRVAVGDQRPAGAARYLLVRRWR